MNNKIIGIGGHKKEHVEEAIERVVKPLLNGCEPVTFDEQYILSPPTILHCIQLEVDDDLLDPRLPNNSEQAAFHYAVAESVKLQCTWILPVTYQIGIGGEYPHNLKQRLDKRLYRSLDIAIETADGKAHVYNFTTGKRQLYTYREVICQE